MHDWYHIATLFYKSRFKHSLVAHMTQGFSFFLEEGMLVNVVPPPLFASRQLIISQVTKLDETSGVVSFDEITTSHQAMLYDGCHVLIPKEKVKKEHIKSYTSDESYAKSFISWDVVDKKLSFYGTVEEVHLLPAQPLLIIAQMRSLSEREKVSQSDLGQVSSANIVGTKSFDNNSADINIDDTTIADTNSDNTNSDDTNSDNTNSDNTNSDDTNSDFFAKRAPREDARCSHKDPKKNVMVPFVEEYIECIDYDTRTLYMDFPSGLLDL